MNSEKLLDSFSELDDRYVLSAAALLGYEEAAMKTKKTKPILRVVLIAAVIATLMIGTAYAMGLFTMDVRTPEEGEALVGQMSFHDIETGEVVTHERDLTQYPLLLEFTGEGPIHKVEYRPGWLPEAGDNARFWIDGDHAAEEWYSYYTCFFDRSLGGAGILYQIQCYYAKPGYTVYMDGKSAYVVKEEDWDELHVTEIEQESYDMAEDGAPVMFRFVLVFNPAEGWFVSIGGTADFETLEQIAREMEFRTLDETVEISDSYDSNYYYLGVGVG